MFIHVDYCTLSFTDFTSHAIEDFKWKINTNKICVMWSLRHEKGLTESWSHDSPDSVDSFIVKKKAASLTSNQQLWTYIWHILE